MIKASDKYKEIEPSICERLDEHGGIQVNVFSLGLGLLGVHHEHKNKVIHIGMLKVSIVVLSVYITYYIMISLLLY